jgi:hypothetical protein
MTENEVKLLGLIKEYGFEDDNPEFYYYAYDVVDGITFISSSSDVVEDDNWYVDIFNTDPIIRFYEFGQVQGLLNTLEKNILKK